MTLERIHPSEIQEEDYIARWGHVRPLKVSGVRHYIYGTSAWHETGNGTHGGFSFTYPEGETIYRVAQEPLANHALGD
jgi:hypothetical protein